jgi:hypothetical protein
MRKFCITTNTAQAKSYTAAPTAALVAAQRSLLGKYGARPSDLMIITGVSTYNALLQVSEVLSAEKYGPGATILTGELARIFNIPIFLSEAIPLTSTDKVAIDGKYTVTDAATYDVSGWLVMVNKNMWTVGFRRDLVIESFRDIQKDSNILVASFRMALIPNDVSTTHTTTGIRITI